MRPRPDEPKKELADTFEMPLLEHLRELRRRIIVAGWAVFIGIAVSFAFAGDIFDWLSAPMVHALQETGKGSLAVTETMEGFIVQMKVAGIAGIFLASPVVTYQIWQFVAPGLYEKERRSVVPLAMSSTGLFLGGGAFAYYGVFQVGFPFFLKMNGDNVTAMLSIDSYLTFAITLLVAFGMSFQLPVVIYFLARLGIVNHRDLISGFRYGVVGIFILAGVLSPPDVLSQFMMAGPLLALYGVGIVVAYFFSTKPVKTLESGP